MGIFFYRTCVDYFIGKSRGANVLWGTCTRLAHNIYITIWQTPLNLQVLKNSSEFCIRLFKMSKYFWIQPSRTLSLYSCESEEQGEMFTCLRQHSVCVCASESQTYCITFNKDVFSLFFLRCCVTFNKTFFAFFLMLRCAWNDWCHVTSQWRHCLYIWQITHISVMGWIPRIYITFMQVSLSLTCIKIMLKKMVSITADATKMKAQAGDKFLI